MSSAQLKLGNVCRSLNPEANVPHADGVFRRRRGGDHRVKPCQQPGTLTVAAAAGGMAAAMLVAPVLIKTLIVVPPNKADATGGERGRETDGSGRER